MPPFSTTLRNSIKRTAGRTVHTYENTKHTLQHLSKHRRRHSATIDVEVAEETVEQAVTRLSIELDALGLPLSNIRRRTTSSPAAGSPRSPTPPSQTPPPPLVTEAGPVAGPSRHGGHTRGRAQTAFSVSRTNTSSTDFGPAYPGYSMSDPDTSATQSSTEPTTPTSPTSPASAASPLSTRPTSVTSLSAVVSPISPTSSGEGTAGKSHKRRSKLHLFRKSTALVAPPPHTSSVVVAPPKTTLPSVARSKTTMSLSKALKGSGSGSESKSKRHSKRIASPCPALTPPRVSSPPPSADHHAERLSPPPPASSAWSESTIRASTHNATNGRSPEKQIGAAQSPARGLPFPDSPLVDGDVTHKPNASYHLSPPPPPQRARAGSLRPPPGRLFVFDVVSPETAPSALDPVDSTAPSLNLSPDLGCCGSANDQPAHGSAEWSRESTNHVPHDYRSSPWAMAASDFCFLARHFGSVWSVSPRHRDGERTGSGNDKHAESTPAAFGQVVMLVLSLAITVVCVASFVMCIPAIAAVTLYVLAASASQGPSIRESQRPDVVNAKGAEREAWLFINGIGTTGSGAQAEIDHMHGLFHRPVTAVLNRSLGVWFDLVESVLQRALHIHTSNMREGYKYVHKAITNPANERVVLIAHSQGGILLATWIDRLLADLPPAALAKVEVYTFASAASHFSLHGATGSVSSPDAPFARVEHFANIADPIAQFGVLGHSRGGAQAPLREDKVAAVYGRYAGRIFARNSEGHGLLDSYLAPDDSILDVPDVRKTSRLALYVDGGRPLASRPGVVWADGRLGEHV